MSKNGRDGAVPSKEKSSKLVMLFMAIAVVVLAAAIGVAAGLFLKPDVNAQQYAEQWAASLPYGCEAPVQPEETSAPPTTPTDAKEPTPSKETEPEPGEDRPSGGEDGEAGESGDEPGGQGDAPADEPNPPAGNPGEGGQPQAPNNAPAPNNSGTGNSNNPSLTPHYPGGTPHLPGFIGGNLALDLPLEPPVDPELSPAPAPIDGVEVEVVRADDSPCRLLVDEFVGVSGADATAQIRQGPDKVHVTAAWLDWTAAAIGFTVTNLIGLAVIVLVLRTLRSELGPAPKQQVIAPPPEDPLGPQQQVGPQRLAGTQQPPQGPQQLPQGPQQPPVGPQHPQGPRQQQVLQQPPQQPPFQPPIPPPVAPPAALKRPSGAAPAPKVWPVELPALTTSGISGLTVDRGSSGQFDVYAASQVGVTHAREGGTREDAYAIGGLPELGWVFIAVGDGLGGAGNSHAASQLATRSAIGRLAGLVRPLAPQAAVARWNDIAYEVVDTVTAELDPNRVVDWAKRLRFVPAKGDEQGRSAPATTLVFAALGPVVNGVYPLLWGAVGDSDALTVDIESGRIEWLTENETKQAGGRVSNTTFSLPRDPGRLIAKTRDVPASTMTVLATDGMADGIRRASEEVGQLLSRVANTTPFEWSFGELVSFEMTGLHDDRTIAAAWPRVASSRSRRS